MLCADVNPSENYSTQEHGYMVKQGTVSFDREGEGRVQV